MPQANELTIDILVAVAEDEARRISERTKAALKAYRDGGHVSKRLREKYDGNVPPAVKRARAGKLGSHLPECRDHLTQEARQRGGADRPRSVGLRLSPPMPGSPTTSEL